MSNPFQLVLHSETFSTYKSHTTFKGLIGIALGGDLTFISQLYAGSISDRELTVRSGFKFQNATEFGNYLRFSISTVSGPKISRRTRENSPVTELS